MKVTIFINPGIVMIDLSVPDSNLYKSANLTFYTYSASKEAFFIISTISFIFIKLVEYVMLLIRMFLILSFVVLSILVLILLSVLTLVMRLLSLIPASQDSVQSVLLKLLNSVLFLISFSSLPEILSALLLMMTSLEKTDPCSSMLYYLLKRYTNWRW